MRKNKILIILGTGVIVLFVVGVVQLLLLRFTAGDVFPFYSSLRSDPLGTKALYESLDRCCGLKVSRNYEPFENIKDRTDAVLFFPGAAPPLQDMLPEAFVMDLESYLRGGGRMVVAYAMAENFNRLRDVLGEDDEEDSDRDKKKDPDRKKEDEKEEDRTRYVSFSKRWKIQYRTYPLEGATNAVLSDGYRDAGLPANLTWHSPLYFDELGPSWRVVYRREGKAVVVEQTMGKGTVILASDSYFLSNEAMVRERNPKLLAWLVGDRSEVVFDEYFHGVASNPGVAALARRYRLQGLIGGILLLVALYIWKNAVSFMPPHSETRLQEAGAFSEGKDSVSGLVNLLRRSIPGRDVLSVCYQEWKKSHSQAAVRTQNQMERIESVYSNEKSAPLRQRDAAGAYNNISRILKER